MSASHHIVVVRHGKAEKSASGSGQESAQRDYDRHLTDRGHADSREAGALLDTALDLPAGEVVALVSSAPRAQETWQDVAAVLTHGASVIADVRDDLYETGVDEIIALLADTDDDVSSVLVVGHDPAMSQTVQALAGDGDADALRRLDDGLSTAAFAVLRHDGGWNAVGPGTCRLERLEVGRALD